MAAVNDVTSLPDPAFTFPPVPVGGINCRQNGTTNSTVYYYDCQAMADRYGINVETFFWLNPSVEQNCSNIIPESQYCVSGCGFSCSIVYICIDNR